MTKKEYIIDSHAHLFLDDYKNDINDVITKMIESDVQLALMPNIEIATIDDMLSLQKLYPQNLRSMIGIHPCYIDENYKKNLLQVEKYLSKEKFVGIGEVGIDRYHSEKTLSFQREAFSMQIAWAKSLNLPLSIHAREALDDVIDILKKNQNGSLKGVLHCFSGTEKQAKEVLDLGFYIGIGGTITYKNNLLRNFLHKININRILLETDSPYLLPQNFKGKAKRNNPSFLTYILSEISNILETDKLKLKKILFNNTCNLFKI